MNDDNFRNTRLFWDDKRDVSIQTDPFIFNTSIFRCSSCNQSIDKCTSLNIDLMQLECQHIYCMQCLKRFTKAQIKIKSNYVIRCPICEYPLREKEIQNINPKYVKRLSKRYTKFIVGKGSMVTCPKCQEKFVFEAGTYAGITTDDEGEKIRPNALDCFRKYRARCERCNTIFCVNCGAVPFHDGCTCEEEKLIKKNVICRFCRKRPAVGCEGVDASHQVCWRKECQECLPYACMHVCKCGHACCGLRDEKVHFGCPLCNHEKENCSSCDLPSNESPSVLLKCGHPWHKNCLISYYQSFKTKGRVHVPRCNHNRICQCIPYHKIVKDAAKKWMKIDKKIEKITLSKMKDEDIENEIIHVQNPNDKDYYQNPLKFAHDFFVFYFCDNCHQPFYGGHKDCEIDNMEEEVNDRNDGYRCLRCQREILNVDCKIHGHDSMVFKCFFCCNVATHFCWGKVYFCDECHKNPYKAQKPPYPICDGKCQFAPHAENGKRIITGYCMQCEIEKEKNMINS